MSTYFLCIHYKYFCYAFGNPACLYDYLLSKCQWDSYEDWYESLTVNLAIMNLDLTLKVEAPAQLIEEKSLYELPEQSNKICSMIMRYTIEKSLRQSIAHTKNANDFLEAIEKKFTRSY